jgi:hypothetical protein
MAASTKYISNMSRALREEVSDVITNIDPTDTVFISNIGKGKCQTTYLEWTTDSLAAATNNAVVEGATATATDIDAPGRTGNYTQISRKVFDISDTMEALDSVGGLTKLAYQTAKKLKELARDMEYAAINNTASSAGGSSTARELCGLKGWVATSLYSFGGATAVTNLLTEDIFVARLQAAWTLGGKPDIVLAPAAQKRKVSAFNGANRITVTEDAGGKKIVNVVDYYETDFGVVRIYLTRNISVDSTNYEWMFFLQKDKFELLTLIPVKVEKLARTGISQMVQISTEYTLRSWQEKASASLKYLYNA